MQPGEAVDNEDDADETEVRGGVVLVVVDDAEVDVDVGVVVDVVVVVEDADVNELHVLLNRNCVTVLAPWYVLSDDKSDKLV
jgi:hypothetical protein